MVFPASLPLSACPLSKSDCVMPAFLLSVCLCLCVTSLSAACLSTVRYFCLMFAFLPSTCLLAVDISVACQPVSCLPIACLPIDCLPFFLNARVFSLSATFLMLAVLLPPVASQTTWMYIICLPSAFSPLVTPASLKYSPLEQQNILFSKLYFLEFVSFFFLFLLIDIFTNSPFSWLESLCLDRSLTS
jgi:hypothetical protein